MTAEASVKRSGSAVKVVNIIIFAVSCFLFLCLITTKHLLGSVGESVSGALLGVFGLSAYGISGCAIALSAISIWGKTAIKMRHIVIFALLYFSITLFIHLVTSNLYMQGEITYSEYLMRCFDFFAFPTFGGVVGGILVYPIAHTSLALGYVLFIIFMLLMLYFSAGCITDIAVGGVPAQKESVKGYYQKQEMQAKEQAARESFEDDNSATQMLKGAMEKLYGNGSQEKGSAQNPKEAPKETPKRIDILKGEEKFATDLPYNTSKSSGKYPSAPVSNYPSADDKAAEQPKERPVGGLNAGRKIPSFNSQDIIDADALSNSIRQKREMQSKQKEQEQVPQFDFEQQESGDENGDNTAINANGSQGQGDKLDLGDIVKPSKDYGFGKEQSVYPADIFAEGEEEEEELIINEKDDAAQNFQASIQNDIEEDDNQPSVKPTVTFSGETIDTSNGRAVQGRMKISYGGEKIEPPPHVYAAYVTPPVELLKESPNKVVHSQEEIQNTAKLLEDTLLSFRIEAKVENVVPGPTVTRYELRMTPGTSVRKVIAIADDIAMNLSAVGSVRIEPQILGKDLFGVEVPNKNAETVTLRTIVDSEEFYRSKGSLNFALGMDIGGKRIIPDLADMPHLLVAGATGMGKSVFLNSLIVSLMYKYSPEELRFLLVDPKQVEFFVFKSSPHLLINQVITSPEHCIAALTWLVEEMERRYGLFKEMGAKNITDYNRCIDRDDTQVMPRIALVIDELNDLMSNFKQDLEAQIKSLAQKARAAGIHLVFATQRPSIDVLTGTIKANFPCRIALKTISFADSKTILDQGGADKLVGRGDMLYISATTPKPVRLQGCYVSMGEVENVLEYVSAKNKPHFDEEAAKRILRLSSSKSAAMIETEDEELDPLFWEALKHFIEQGSASISLLQRRFSVGYNRAGRIIEQLCDKKFISEFEGAKPRRVMITIDEYNTIHGEDE